MLNLDQQNMRQVKSLRALEKHNKRIVASLTLSPISNSRAAGGGIDSNAAAHKK